MLQADLTQFKTQQEVYDYLGQIKIRHFNVNNNNNTINNNIRTTRQGKEITCRACGGNHYMHECTNQAKLMEYKEKDPEDMNDLANHHDANTVKFAETDAKANSTRRRR